MEKSTNRRDVEGVDDGVICGTVPALVCRN
jgi:hypothetical protein